MRRTEGNFALKSPIVYSMLSHFALLAFMSLSSFVPVKNDVVFSDVQLVGEGEFRDILDNYQAVPVAEIVSREEQKEELKVPEEPQSESTLTDENLSPAQPLQPEPKPESPEPEEPKPESAPIEENPPPSSEPQPTPAESREIVFEELPQSENPTPIEEQRPFPSEEPKEEEKIDKTEEPIPLPDEKPPEQVPEVKKTPKKRSKKVFQDVIKRAEKKKAREKNRKKVLEIAEKAEKIKKNAVQKKKKDSAFDKMIHNSINDLKKTSGQGKKGTGVGNFGSGEKLADSDYEIISSQIYPHWVVPSGVRDAENIIVEIEVQLRDSGEIVQSGVKILDERRYVSDYVFRAAADSARRAVLETGTLKIPRDKISLFKKFVLRFNLKEALGG